MAKRLSLSIVKAAEPAAKDYFLWDSDLKGFGLKVCAGGRKSYVCKYRAGFGRAAPTRRITIGAHGSPWTPDAARREAARILGLAAQGGDPARDKQTAKGVITVAELCERYLKAGVAIKKLSTLKTDKGRIERHIKPLLGKKRIADVSRSDVSQFMQDIAAGKTAADIKTGKRGRAIVRGGKGTATRTVGLLGGIFSFAVESGLLTANPVRGVKRYRDRRNERFLNENELGRLGRALCNAEVEGENPYAIAIIRMLILTGARKGEIESLKRSEIDSTYGCLRLADSKTGQKLVVLNKAALAILDGIEPAADSEYVFPASVAEGWYQGTPKVWRRIRNAAELADVRLHDLRHSFASAAAASGASLQVIGALLGHKDQSTTARYAHLSEDPIRAASQDISASLATQLGTRNSGEASDASR
ncbi:MAG: tyrosine-type recombinase/integrase [Pseudomonadota bacterium]